MHLVISFIPAFSPGACPSLSVLSPTSLFFDGLSEDMGDLLRFQKNESLFLDLFFCLLYLRASFFFRFSRQPLLPANKEAITSDTLARIRTANMERAEWVSFHFFDILLFSCLFGCLFFFIFRPLLF
jgi:hypothetical protein